MKNGNNLIGLAGPAKPIEKRKLPAESGRLQKEDYMKYSTKCVVIASLSGLLPCGLLKSAAQPTNVPADSPATKAANGGTSQIPRSATTTNPVSKSQTGFPGAPQPKAHQNLPAKFFGQSKPSVTGMTFVDDLASPAVSSGVTSLSPGLDPAREPSRDDLVPPFLPPLEPTKSAFQSSVRPTGKLNFNLFHPLVQTAPENQPLQIEGMGTRAWTTLIGWYPCESTFADARIYEPQFDLFWAGASPQR